MPRLNPPPPQIDHGRNNGNGLSDSDSGCALEEYTWVPPGLKPEQVNVPGLEGSDFVDCDWLNVFCIPSPGSPLL